MLLGNNVYDQNFDWAEFQELGSAPPAMEAARAADALSLFPGYRQNSWGCANWMLYQILRYPSCN